MRVRQYWQTSNIGTYLLGSLSFFIIICYIFYSMQNVHSDGLIHQRGPAILAPGYLAFRPALVYVRTTLNDCHTWAGHVSADSAGS